MVTITTIMVMPMMAISAITMTIIVFGGAANNMMVKLWMTIREGDDTDVADGGGGFDDTPDNKDNHDVGGR